MKTIHKLAKSSGFTLIELLVVISIIGILASVVLVSLNSARAKSRDARRISDIKQTQTALELFVNDTGGYPSAVASGGTIACGSNTYINPVPTNPTPNGSTYTYANSGTAASSSACGAAQNVYPSYTLTFTLEGPTGLLASGGHTASPSGIQ